MGDGGGGNGGSTVMGGGGGASVGSGRVSDRGCCRLLGVIRELWEDLPYSFPFFWNSFSRMWGGGLSRLAMCLG